MDIRARRLYRRRDTLDERGVADRNDHRVALWKLLEHLEADRARADRNVRARRVIEQERAGASHVRLGGAPSAFDVGSRFRQLCSKRSDARDLRCVRVAWHEDPCG